MKKMINKAFCVLAMIFACMPFIAQGLPDSFLVDDVQYFFDNDSSTHVHASYYTGNSTSITIPRSVVCEYRDYNDKDSDGNPKVKRITCTVTGVNLNNTSLRSVTITEGISSIDFSGCTSLENVNIPDSVTEMGGAFKDCYSLTSVTIPNSVTSIGKGAFLRCNSLARVTIPDSVTSIGEDAFSYCSSLASVTIPNSVTSIGKDAFSYCSSLTSVTIPDSVTSIGEDAFSYCSSLESVTIPDSVTSIGDPVFDKCNGMKEVTVPQLVLNCGIGLIFGDTAYDIESVAFSGSITNITGFVDCRSLESLTIPDSVTSIGDRAFGGCSSLVSVTIPDSVTSIGEEAFYNCSSLVSVMIPDSVTSIGEVAFYNCSSLESVTIPDSVTSIEKSTFNNCSSLTSVTIGDGVTSIGEDAFYNCRSLNDVYLSDIEAWCGIDFSDFGTSPFYYAKNLYLDGKLVTAFEIPDGVTKISNNAFYDADCIQRVSIPDSVTSIGSYSFQKCDNIISAKAPQSVMGMGLSTIFKSSYQKLQSLCLGANVTAIGADEFNSCQALTHVEVEAGNVCYVKGEDGCLYDIERKQLLFCPRDKERINIPKGVTTIGKFAFQYCTNLVSVSMPNTLQTVGTYSFYGCSKLSGLTIPNGVKTLPPTAFDGCDVLWTEWYRALALLAVNGGGSSGGEGVEPVDPRYVLSTRPTDRSIATIMVDGDTAIDSFVLSDGKVYDTVVRVINVSDGDVRLSLPQDYIYEQFKGASPLVIPATSTNLLTITRTAERVFFVSREELESAQ